MPAWRGRALRNSSLMSSEEPAGWIGSWIESTACCDAVGAASVFGAGAGGVFDASAAGGAACGFGAGGAFDASDAGGVVGAGAGFVSSPKAGAVQATSRNEAALRVLTRHLRALIGVRTDDRSFS
jgi:hypothetical protein